ncbi:MAG: hypothetical protein AB8W37_05845 [Arsenophonus endosymbiont of Dermacentor nuttalli]
MTFKITKDIELFELDSFVVTHTANDYLLWPLYKLYCYGDKVGSKNKNWQLISSEKRGWSRVLQVLIGIARLIKF